MAPYNAITGPQLNRWPPAYFTLHVQYTVKVVLNITKLYIHMAS